MYSIDLRDAVTRSYLNSAWKKWRRHYGDMKINDSTIDILSFSFSPEIRKIEIRFDDQIVVIREEKLPGSDLWIVPSANLEAVLSERFLPFYPMFFGMLLTALHENKTQVPIFGIVLKDVETAFEDPDTRQGFVNCIASGIYISNGQ
ncbi:hypothetical protein ACUXPM_000228 [Ralstonia sp. 151470066-2]|nr:hypothetical protein [Ralstonia insidiosa]MBX3810261.1 hypothetical protein [Ralstonia pickettii]NOZ17148.1 hypothetical protein [Betaproteobacteria bacterium]MBX3815876.1 hypothetical protein [Ralstonia insidiosa]MBX3834358.1 hypothetical protein [Ralstonia insidiosa]